MGVFLLFAERFIGNETEAPYKNMYNESGALINVYEKLMCVKN